VDSAWDGKWQRLSRIERRAACDEVLFFEGLGAVSQGIKSGPLGVWENLAEDSGGAGFFQRPLWCMSWYEAYVDEWEPVVALAISQGEPIGLAALAKQKASGEIVFAGGGMADYRDFVTLPAQRDRAVEALVQAVLRLSGGRFAIGPTEPGSTTIAEVLAAGERTGEWRGIIRTHPCWRVVLTQRLAELVGAKKSIKRHRAYYRRLGDLQYQRVRNADEWEVLREVFFEQHTLRQLYTGREPSFHDSRKRNFFDRMFHLDPQGVHVSALWLGERCLASHFGYAAGGTVYWGAPAMDVSEERHSPGQLLLADLIADAVEGYREIDFTMGMEGFKARFGTVCVTLPQVHVYAKRWRYWTARLQQIGIAGAKAGVCRIFSEQARKTVREMIAQGARWPAAQYAAPTRVREEGRRSLVTLAVLHDRFRVRSFPVEKRNGLCFHENEIGDFAKCRNPMEVAPVLRAAIERAGRGLTLHTLLVDAQLVGYGWSLKRGQEAYLSGFKSVSSGGQEPLVGVHIGFVVQHAFEQGALRVCVSCGKSERALHRQLEEMGFLPIAPFLREQAGDADY
jgi:CelD/BcsL family acetyltransferase involved in cellulose biosynthesis